MLNYAAGNPVTGYNLTRSLRFRASASAYFSRTPATSTNRKVWTYSAWIKRGTLGTRQMFFEGYASGAEFSFFEFTSGDNLRIINTITGSTQAEKITTQVFRDPSAWYHIVIASNSSTSLNLYVNGVQVTSFSTSTGPNATDWAFNQILPQVIGGDRTSGSTTSPFDGYQAELNWIDGQALTPSSFGSTNSTTGVWQPAAYTGTYGTNGFYLPFTDNSALTTSSNVGLGKDFSGNGNYWTTNNISITAGTTYDSMTDVPTLTSATAANFAVCNPLKSSTTLSQANLYSVEGGAGSRITTGSIGMTSGKYYWEVTIGSSGNMLGICNSFISTADGYLGATVNGWGYASDGTKYTNGSGSAYGATYTTGDVIGIAFDAAAGTLVFYKNNASQGTAFTGLTSGPYFAGSGNSTGCSQYYNFGQRPFTYTPPSGFVALNTYNLPDSTIKQGNKVMDATLYTGNLVGQVITNAATFQPDLVWVKSRSAATDNKLTDSVRGATKALISNSSAAETTDITGVVSFNSNGFTLGTSTTYNNLAATYVGWQWKANGAAVSNTSGTITSTVSVNASAGFSVVTYTGNGVSGATVGHGLGVAPTFWIIKRRDGPGDWKALSTVTGSVLMGDLNTQNVWSSPGSPMTTAPTSTVITLDSSGDRNGSGQTYVIYAWTPIAGYSSITYFNGNGSTDGPFVYTGFRPKFTLSKDIDGGSYWGMYDSVRSTYNVASARLNADLSDAETTEAVYDYLSNGIKLRSSTLNQNNHKHILISFAENPFKNALAR